MACGGGSCGHRISNMAQSDPQASQHRAQGVPKWSQGIPKTPQCSHRCPKVCPKASRWHPKASQREPKAPQRETKGTQCRPQRTPWHFKVRKSIYTKTPHQPHQRPLCYREKVSPNRCEGSLLLTNSDLLSGTWHIQASGSAYLLQARVLTCYSQNLTQA